MRAGRLAAAALAHEGRGRIVSVHRRAINLMLDGGAIVSLLPRDTPLHPWAIVGDFDASQFRMDDEVSVEDGSLRIQFGEMRVEDLSLRSRPDRICQTALDSSASLTLRQTGSDPWDQRISRALNEFCETSHPVCLARLVGLGGGLTPSGDDVIVGALAALDLIASAAPDAPAIRKQLADTLPRPLADHTPRLSAQMISAAIDGQYPEPLLHLCEAVAEGGIPTIREAASAVISLGHRSGRDMLRGFTETLIGWLPDSSG